MNSVPTWLESRLLSKVKSHLEAGAQIEDLDILSGGPVQAIKVGLSRLPFPLPPQLTSLPHRSFSALETQSSL